VTVAAEVALAAGLVVGLAHHAVAHGVARDLTAHGYHLAREFMSQDDGGIVGELIVENVDIGATDASEGDADEHLILSVGGDGAFGEADVAFSLFVLDQSEHDDTSVFCP
jgi:hypothetical protein